MKKKKASKQKKEEQSQSQKKKTGINRYLKSDLVMENVTEQMEGQVTVSFRRHSRG